MKSSFKNIVDVISKTIDPDALNIKIRHGEDVSDVSEEISENLSKLEFSKISDIDANSFEILIWTLALAYSGKGYRYPLNSKKCRALDDIYFSVVEALTRQFPDDK